jgi:YihY family inner membrane protein
MSLSLRGTLQRLDHWQGSHPVVAIPVAVVKKFGDDRAGRHAALIAYYGFFSLFPLLLVLVSLLGFALQNNPELQQRVLDSALAQFPVIGQQIESNIGALTGSFVTLAVGLATALWYGIAVISATQDAMDEVWNVARRDRPSFVRSKLRALLGLVVIGTFLVTAAVLAGVGADGGWPGIPLRVAALVGTVALNVAVFAGIFRILTVADVGWRDVLPGAVLAGVGWLVLLAVGSWLVDHQVRNASHVYGIFAIVIGLLGWVYLGAQLLLFAAELNAVLKRGLWPRTLGETRETTRPDREVIAGEAKEEAAGPDERVAVRFGQRRRRSA